MTQILINFSFFFFTMYFTAIPDKVKVGTQFGSLIIWIVSLKQMLLSFFTMFFHHESLKGEPLECYFWYLVVVTRPIHTLRPWHRVVCTVTGLNFIIMHFWNSPLWFKHPHAHKTAFNAGEWQQVAGICHNVVLRSYICTEKYLLTIATSGW